MIKLPCKCRHKRTDVGFVVLNLFNLSNNVGAKGLQFVRQFDHKAANSLKLHSLI